MTAAQRIALFGATRTAGHATAKALRDAGHTVTALGRSDPRIGGVSFVPADIAAPDLSHLKPDAVISWLASRTGAPADAWAIDHASNMALLQAAKTAGTSQFILLSAICVQKPLLAFQHAKLTFEAELIGSGLTYAIVRPTAFFKSLSGQIDRLCAGKPYLMFGDGKLTACKSISDADLGRFIATCLNDPAKQNAILPIGGPGPALTPCDMGSALFDTLNLPPKYRAISPKVVRTIASAFRVRRHAQPDSQSKSRAYPHWSLLRDGVHAGLGPGRTAIRRRRHPRIWHRYAL